MVVIIIFALAIPLRGQASGKPQSSRRSTFSDPAERFPMPPQWIARPVVHEKDAKGADIVVSLDQGLFPRLRPLIEEYARARRLKIVVTEGTCGISAGALAKKTVDISGFCCPPSREDRLPGVRYHTLGIDPIVFFVNSLNPIEDLSSKQLRDIFSGGLHRWSSIRSSGNTLPDRSIKAVVRLHCKTRPGHWRQLLDDETLFSPYAMEVGSIPDMVGSVSSDPDSIGWEVPIMIGKYGGHGKVRILRVDGHTPLESAALSTLRYPFYRVYNITTWEGEGVANDKAYRLVSYLKKAVETMDPAGSGFLSAGRLRKAGWKFAGDELTGEPR